MHLLKAYHPHGPDSQQSGRVLIYVWRFPPVMSDVESVGKVIFVNPVRNSSPAIAGLETERGIIPNGVNLVSIKSNTYQLGNGPNRSFCRDSVDDKFP